MQKPTLKERIQYWFDNRMSRGTGSMIKMLGVATIVLVVLIALLITVFNFNEDAGFMSALWDSLATTINAWMPYSEEGGAGYIILTAIAAVVGLLFTSVLIGIVGTAIEDKLTSLRQGGSRILEEGHLVLLGYAEGEHELLRQLVLAAGENPSCIVVAGEMDKVEMEDNIRDNVEIPSNVKIICRNLNVTDPQALNCCSITTARAVVVCPGDDETNIRCVLAVSRLIKDSGVTGVRIIASVSRDEFLLPRRSHINVLQTNDIVARIIAYSCTQPGLSAAFTEIFNFEGSEIHIARAEKIKGLTEAVASTGMTFGDLTVMMENGVPLGYYREKVTYLNPSPDTALEPTDRIIFFAETSGSPVITEAKKPDTVGNGSLWESFADVDFKPHCSENHSDRLAIIGYNEVFDTIINEIPDDVGEVLLAGVTKEQADEAASIIEKALHAGYAGEDILKDHSEDNEGHQEAEGTSQRNIRLIVSDADITTFRGIEEAVTGAAHVILLSGHEDDANTSDVRTMVNILRLRDLRKKKGISFNVTAELHHESNRRLVVDTTSDDFIVASDMTSMILAQLAETERLGDVFRELLSNGGSEIYLRPAGTVVPTDCELTTAQMRAIVLKAGYLLLGYISYEETGRTIILNPGLGDTVTLKDTDNLIVIGPC
ncbi:MAG: NAD-binding protein [Eubacteriales bacterium]|nr:NAD-binding protein [Eubacteriales bacterium]